MSGARGGKVSALEFGTSGRATMFLSPGRLARKNLGPRVHGDERN